jgi:hypothetical protein
MPMHTGLFDALKSGAMGLGRGALGVFTGPQDPRLQTSGVGQREALIAAGLGTLASQDQNPLGAIAQGAMLGQQASGEAQQRQIQMQNQARMRELMGMFGVDRQGLLQMFAESIAQGDMETARTFSEIIKSMQPSGTRQPPRIDTVLTPDAPADVRQRLGEGARVSVALDPSSQPMWDTAQPTAPPFSPYVDVFVEPSQDSETGAFRVGITSEGRKDILGMARLPGASGGGAGGMNTALAQAGLRELDTAYNPEMAEPIQGLISSLAAKSGTLLGDLANIGLGQVNPELQKSISAMNRVLSYVVRIMSGAAMTNQEFERYKSAFSIRVGDQVPNITAKKEALQTIFERLSISQDADGNEFTVDTVTGQRVNTQDVRQLFEDAEAATLSVPGAGVTERTMPNGRPDFRPGGQG